jgi:uncharacterized protein
VAPWWIRLKSVKKGYAKLILAAFLVVIVSAGGALLALSLLEERILFHPSATIEATPDVVGLAYEDVHLRTLTGETIAGWFIPARDPFVTILFLHGNAGNISHRLTTLSELHAQGISLLIIDYRGYGESGGSPSEAGMYADAHTAWDHLTGARGVAPRGVVLYGESIGSTAALRLASDLRRLGEQGPAAVIVEGALTSALEMGRRVFPFLPVRWVARARLDNLAAVGEVDAPTLFIHAGNDEIVPLEMGRRLYASSISRLKEFHEVPGATHNTVWIRSGHEVAATVRRFLGRAMEGA